MNKLSALRFALKHMDSCLTAVELIDDIERMKRADGTIARKDRSRLMSRFWAMVKTV
jgi:hypothetical protein